MLDTFLDALTAYLYGMGWLVICISFSAIGFKVLDRVVPIDFRKEIEERNMPFAVLLGLFMFGLSFGTLYFAAHM